MKLRPPNPENRLFRLRKRLLKSVLIPILCVLGLVLVLFFVLRSLFPRERMRELAITQLEETTGLSISVEDASISFVHWRVGIKVSGVEISAPVGEEETKVVVVGAAADSTRKVTELARVATIPQLGVAVSLLPLLKREIVVDELYVKSPQVTLRFGGERILRRPQGKPSRGPTPMPMSLSLSRAVVSDADIELEDVRTGSVIELKHLDASSSIRGDKSTEILLFEGKFAVKEVSVRSTKRLPIEISPLTVKTSWKASFDVKNRLLDLERVSVKVSEFPIEATGKVNLIGEKPDLDVKVKIEKIAVEKLLAFVPKKLLEKSRGIRIDGEIEAYASIRGKMPSPEVNVEKFVVSAGGSSVSGRALVKTLEPQSISFETTGNLKLSELVGMLPATAGPRVTSGTASFHVTGGGLVKELKTNPLAMQAQGEASVSSVSVELPEPSPPVLLDTAHMILNGRSLEITGATAKAGSSVFNASGRVRDWKERSIELDVRSPMLDLGELLLPVAKQKKAPKKEGGKITVPAGGIRAKGTATLRVDMLKFGNFGARDLDAKVVFGGDSIVVTDMTMNALGGKCGGKSRLVLSKDGSPAYRASFSADDLEMRELLNSLTPVKDFMSGVSFFQISVEGNIPKDTSPLKSVAAKGQVKATQAKAVASPLVSAIASWVGFQKSDQYALKDFATSFLVQEGRVILPQCRLQERNSIWDFAGSTGFDGTLDYKVNVTLSQDYSKRTGSLRGLEQLVKDDQGRVVLDLIVGGTVKKPVFKWDSARMQQRGQEFLTKKVRGQLEAQTKKGEELKQQVTTELEKRADTLKVEAAAKGAKLLEDLLRKRKK